MKLPLIISLLGVCIVMTSCTSEYEECLEEGRNLKAKLAGLKSHNLTLSDEFSSMEEKEIYNEINLLAKISGNEQLFLKEVFSN